MSPERVKIFLVGSLLLNVFIIGGVVGGGAMWLRAAKARQTQQTQQTQTPPLTGIPKAAEQLSQEQQMELRQAIRKARREDLQKILEADEARHQAADLMVQENLDKAAIAAALTRARSADFALRTQLEAAVLDFAETLSVEDRRTLADGLSRAAFLRQAKRDANRKPAITPNQVNPGAK